MQPLNVAQSLVVSGICSLNWSFPHSSLTHSSSHTLVNSQSLEYSLYSLNLSLTIQPVFKHVSSDSPAFSNNTRNVFPATATQVMGALATRLEGRNDSLEGRGQTYTNDEQRVGRSGDEEGCLRTTMSSDPLPRDHVTTELWVASFVPRFLRSRCCLSGRDGTIDDAGQIRSPNQWRAACVPLSPPSPA